MPEGYPEQNPKAAWRVYDGEAVIVSPEDSTLHTLNAVGTVIWEAAAFVDSLSRRGLLTILHTPRPAA